jgi:hypothetical protein
MAAQALSDWDLIRSFLPADLDRIALEYRAIRPQYADTKIKTGEDLVRLLLVHAGVGIPLRQAVEVFKQGTGIDVSHKTLHQRLRRSGAFLHELVKAVSEVVREVPAELWAGYDVLAADATVVTRPGSCGTDARIHTLMRLSALECVEVKATDVHGGETLRNFTFSPGQLVIGDRGYSTGRGFAHVVDQGADVLVRVNRGSLRLLDAYGEEIDVLAIARQLAGHGVEEFPVRAVAVADDEREIVGRLVMMRLPKDKAAEARKRAIEEHGRNVSADTLEAAQYVVLFTTAPAARLSGAQCMLLYRARWQIELKFKRWKSLCNFDELPKFRDDTTKAWLYAKILTAMLLDRISSQPSGLSPPIAA